MSVSPIIRDRLERELLKDVSLHVTEQGTDAFNVAGRGEMHLSILIETMRREGYEFAVTRPKVILKEGPNGIHENCFHRRYCRSIRIRFPVDRQRFFDRTMQFQQRKPLSKTNVTI